MTGPPLIGILAGMGPDSTAPFLQAVIDECRRQYGARHDPDFPPILVLSLPTPFYPDRPLDDAAMVLAIRSGLERLRDAGARFVAMPCNTAHLYYDELAAGLGVPLLHIVEETLAALPPRSRAAAILATRASAEQGLYRKPLEAAGIAVVARPEWQGRIDRLLVELKAGAGVDELLAGWRTLLAEVAGTGADVLVVGCTDLAPLAARDSCGLAVVDSSDCLAAAVVRRYRALA